jgi:hypothetical protein
MQYIWSAVLLMNCNLLDVTLSQLCIYTNVSKVPTAYSSTGRRVTVPTEVSSSKHLQNGTMFLTECTTETVSYISFLKSIFGDCNII